MLRREGANHRVLRALQPFLVSIYPKAFDELAAVAALEEITEAVFALTEPFHKHYHHSFGLLTGEEPLAEPDALVF